MAVNSKSYILPIILALPFIALAQKVKTVEAEYTYCAPSNLSPVEAKTEAVKRAQIEAIANEFGRIVTSNNYLRMTTKDGESHTSLNVIGESEVKGEWLRAVEPPKVKNMFIQDDMSTCITVFVKGEAAEIVSAPVRFEAKILRNGTDDRFESDDFKAGDKFYMSFRSPANGYLAIYMIDDEGNAFRLLPYQDADEAAFSVKRDKSYVLFSEGHELDAFCDRPMEFNHVYTIFSPHQFTRPLDKDAFHSKEGQVLPPKLSLKEFQKWFVGMRKFDKDLSVDRRTFRITK